MSNGCQAISHQVQVEIGLWPIENFPLLIFNFYFFELNEKKQPSGH
jgi:hypothetical protein